MQGLGMKIIAEIAEQFGVNIRSFLKYIYKHRSEHMGRRINKEKNNKYKAH